MSYIKLVHFFTLCILRKSYKYPEEFLHLCVNSFSDDAKNYNTLLNTSIKLLIKNYITPKNGNHCRSLLRQKGYPELCTFEGLQC